MGTFFFTLSPSLSIFLPHYLSPFLSLSHPDTHTHTLSFSLSLSRREDSKNLILSFSLYIDSYEIFLLATVCPIRFDPFDIVTYLYIGSRLLRQTVSGTNSLVSVNLAKSSWWQYCKPGELVGAAGSKPAKISNYLYYLFFHPLSLFSLSFLCLDKLGLFSLITDLTYIYLPWDTLY